MSKNRRIVEAAGGILWQRNARTEQIEVCVVHRPKYDDWSWPKGKLEHNESHRHAAVREMGEETGCHVELGAYLGEVEYPLSAEGKKSRGKVPAEGAMKHVLYWMAQPIDNALARRMAEAFGPVHRADAGEINDVQWLDIERARKKLTHSTDRDILALFVDRLEEGAADASTLLLVRHAKAEPRKAWKGTDAARPITPLGAAAAYALDRELACYAPERLSSSPWIRCQQTMQVLSWQTGLPVRLVDALTEDAFAADPQAAWDAFAALIDDTVDGGDTEAVCMHRPVIGGMFEHLRPLCANPVLARKLIAKTPYMPTGNALALTFTRGADGRARIIDIQKVAPIVY
ncbi:MAG: NUDIX domain-containing protein [Bifidobacterium sp.]|nr:NUDIX domain-containing protein [Bifidobacterium sp.]